MSGWLIRWNAPLLACAIVLAGGGYWLSSKLSFDWQVTAMFAKGDPQVEAYHQLQRRFGGNEIVLAVYRDPQLWEEDGSGLERLARVSERLASVEGVSAVLSLAELHQILEQMRASRSVAEKLLKSRLELFGIANKKEKKLPPLLDPDNELAQAFASVFEGYTHRRDSEYVAIACLLEQNTPESSQEKQPRHAATVARLRKELEQLPAPADSGLIAGEPVLVVDGFALVEQDGLRLGITSTVLVALTLLVSFRSLRWTLIPLLVVQWSLIATQALLVALGLQLTMVSSTLTAIVTVIGVATTTHLILRFQEFRRQGKGRAEALQMTYGILLKPIAWACCTDALGFIALLSADVGPVRDFGLMMAIGSGMVFVAVCFVVPGLALIGRWDADPSTPRIDMFLRLSLRKVMEWCLQRRRVCLALLALLSIAAIVGCMRVQVETDFTRNFSSDSPLVSGYQIIEGELGGAGVWDVMVPIPKVITNKYLTQVLELQQQLASIEINGPDQSLKLQKVLSLANAIEATNTDSFLSALPLQARISGMSATMPEFTRALISAADEEDGRWLRIMLRSPEQAPAQSKSQLIAEVQRQVDDFTNSDAWQAVFPGAKPKESAVTGYHVMLAQLVESVIRDQWKCFLVALILIGSAMTLAFKSWRFALAALLPNVLPILAVLGAMGWLSIRVNMGAAMMAAVSMGLSIDSSIHYLMHYRRRSREGVRPLKALRSAQENVGLAALLATVSLIAGFLTMAVSEFMPTVVFGILAALSMLGGLLGNLVILPLLIAKPK